MLLIGLVTVLVVILQSCQGPKSPLDRYSVASLKKLTVLEAAPPQPSMVFKDADGEPMRLTAYRGQVVLVNVWATWCPPCIAEMPSLNTLQETKGGADFQVITISLDRTAAEAKAWLDKKNLTALRSWHDGTYQLNGAAQLPGLPTSILYDRAGNEVARIPGEVDWASSEAANLVDFLVSQ